MEMVMLVPLKERKPGRPRAITEEIEAIVVELYQRGYGYRAIARILRRPEYGLNPHYSSVRQCLIRLDRIKKTDNLV